MKARLYRTLAEIAADAIAADSMPETALLTPREAVDFLAKKGRPLAPATLKNYRVTRPELIPFVRQGRAVNYRAGDLARFAEGERA